MEAKLDEAKVAELQTALYAAETSLNNTDIIVPINGTVVSRNVEIGQTVAAGSDAQPLFLIATDPWRQIERECNKLSSRRAILPWQVRPAEFAD